MRLNQPRVRRKIHTKLRNPHRADRFLSDDEQLHEFVVLAGGSYPDHLRIELTKPRINEVLNAAFKSYMQTEVCVGAYNVTLK